VEGLEPDQGVDVQPRQQLGRLRCDLLDVDATLGRQHQQRPLLSTVERDREVVLRGDLGGLLDPQLAYGMAADVHAEDRPGVFGRLAGGGCNLDPAGLPATADQHLRLDHDRGSELLRRRTRLLRRIDRHALGDRDPEACEELLALILVEVHVAPALGRRGLPAGV
jgi:hypothetical protein